LVKWIPRSSASGLFIDDDFGLLDSKAKTLTVKTDEDRLIDSFEGINAFLDKNKAALSHKLCKFKK